MTKKLVALLLAAILLMAAGHAEWFDDGSDGYGFDFDDDGYTGTWTEIPSLGLEFCLPEGWTEAEAGEDAAFAATREDGAASLKIRAEAGDVEDLEAWAGENLEAWEPAEAIFYDAAVVQREGALTVYILSGGTLVSLAFESAAPDAVPLKLALQIAGSVGEIWVD